MFDIFGDIIPKKVTKPEPTINGMYYIPNWITDDEHDYLLSSIDSMPWQIMYNRRIQQYGYLYDFVKVNGKVLQHNNIYIGELPPFLQYVSDKLYEQKIFQAKPDQVVINEYLPGQGIGDHIDCVPCFGDVLISLTLSSQCVMDLKKGDNVVYKALENKSLLILKDESRYEWTHGIRKNKSDIINGKWVPRGRRVAITMRKTI